MKFDAFKWLQRKSRWQQWLLAVLFSVLLTEAATSLMAHLLKGEVPADFLLTGLVVSLFVASLGVALIGYFHGQIANGQLQLQNIIFDTAPVGILTTDSKLFATRANASLLKMLGYTMEELSHLTIMDVTHPGDLDFSREALNKLMDTKCNVLLRDNRFICKNGSILWVDAALSAMSVSDDCSDGVLAIITDVTARKATAEEINHLAFYDALTQLPNRSLLNDRLKQAMGASKRSGRYGAAIFLDLDNFKPINDSHGHGVGDLLLVEVARRLTSCVREMDTVARFGGDEFVVILGELDAGEAESINQAGVLAEKIRSILDKPYVLRIHCEGKEESAVEHVCTASIGVALFIDHGNSQEDILKWADMAMYQAKDEGGNLIRFYGLPAQTASRREAERIAAQLMAQAFRPR